MSTAHTRTLPTLVKAIIAVAMLALTVAAGSAALAPAAEGSGGVSATEGQQTGDRYDRLWKRTTRRERRWANRVAMCESGRDPRAIGGGGRYRGAFQFLRRTWRNSPRSPGGDPIRYRYKVQAVVAVHLKRREGRSPWPVCG